MDRETKKKHTLGMNAVEWPCRRLSSRVKKGHENTEAGIEEGIH